jgi:hypothetical protein
MFVVVVGFVLALIFFGLPLGIIGLFIPAFSIRNLVGQKVPRKMD